MERTLPNWYRSVLFLSCYIQLEICQQFGFAFSLYQPVSTKNIDAGSHSEIDNCPYGFDNFGMSCYKLYTTAVSRARANALCAEENSHLVDITSQSEQDFVAGLLEDNPVIKEMRRDTNNRYIGAWIGLMVSEASGGMLVWSDGTELDFTSWDAKFGRNEPDVDCVRMDSRYRFNWGDRACKEPYSFVCETAPDVTLETAIPSNAKIDITTATVAAQSDMDNNNYSSPMIADTGKARPSHSGKPHHNVNTIIICCCVLATIVVLVIGMVIFCLHLRKRNCNSGHYLSPASISSPKPINQNRILTSDQEETSDVRTSVQSNGYIEFKPESQGQPINSVSSKDHIVHTYFDPKQQGAGGSISTDSIKHTYFVPSNVFGGQTTVGHVYADINEDKDRSSSLLDSSSTYASVQ